MKISNVLFTSALSFVAIGSVSAGAYSTEAPSASSLNFSAEKDENPLAFTFWRGTLASGEDTLLMKIKSIANKRLLICGSSFSVRQNNKEFGDLKLDSGEGDVARCQMLVTEKTFVLDQDAADKFNTQGAYTIVFNNSYQFNIPAQATKASGTMVDENLDLHIITATYQTKGSSLDVWANLKFSGTDQAGNYVWTLNNYGVNPYP